jgi:hypothetical protein
MRKGVNDRKLSRKYWFIPILLILFLGIIYFANPVTPKTYPYPILPEWKTCDDGEHCLLVDLECCPDCDSRDDIPINNIGLEKIAEWSKYNCQGCPSCVGPFWGAIGGACSDGFCSVGVVCSSGIGVCEHYGYNLDESFRFALESQLVRADMSLEEAFEYCNCSEKDIWWD